MSSLFEYAELQCTTNFSFLRGASHPDELVAQAAEQGHRAVAITDENSLAGVVRAHVAAKEAGIQLVIGARLTPQDGPALLLYPTDRAAYGRLSRLITLGRRRAPKGQCRLSLEDVLAHAEGQIAVVLPPAGRAEDWIAAAERIASVFGDRGYLAVQRRYGPDDDRFVDHCRGLAARTRLPLVATNDVHYHVPERRPLQDVLTCIRCGCAIGSAGRRLLANAERHLKPPQEMARLFRHAPDALARSVEIAARCRFSLDELRYEYPTEIAPDGRDPMDWLTELTWRLAPRRFGGNVPESVRRQLGHELALIRQLRYEAYFLTVYDVVSFARSRGILCQGRGSAANSAVCYCLGITSVDPARIDLLFERFVSAERDEPPDIDVDFEHERREEVIQYIYGKFGRERAGLTAEVISYRPRSAVREVGKALGLSLDAVGRLAETCDWWDDAALPTARLREAGFDPADRTVRLLVELTRALLSFPRHLSQHVGGFVMTRGPLCELVPIENAAMEDRTVIEWNKDDIEALGILKVDVLGLGMLTCVRKALEFLEGTEAPRRRGTGKAEPGSPRLAAKQGSKPASVLQLHTIPPEDPAVYDMICAADTVGVFQIESRAQMGMLPRLRPRCFYDLVIEVAIVRPGPIQGDMVHPYLRRRRGEEAVTYPNPAVADVLRKTLGVPLFQEQVMRLAVVAAGFTPGEADQLRRAMAAWKRQGIIDKFRNKFINGMLSNGYDRGFAERLFDQIRGFGEYGFPESHAASFALLVYVSAWLKRYHPAAFAAALLNSQPMGFYAPAQIIRDARAHGVTVLPVDVNASEWDCTLERHKSTEAPAHEGMVARSDGETEKRSGAGGCAGSGATGGAETWGRGGPAIRLGLRMVRGLPREAAERLVRARRLPFRSVSDVFRRSGLSRKTLARLAEADAFGTLGLSRRAATWLVLALDDSPADAPLFDGLEPVEPQTSLPTMPRGQEVAHDYWMTGLSLKAHPIELVRRKLDEAEVVPCAQMNTLHRGRRAAVAGVIICRQRPDTASGVLFVSLEDETGTANLIVRPEVYERFRAAIRGAVLLEAEGRIDRDGEVVHLLVDRARDLSSLLPQVVVRSRDFH